MTVVFAATQFTRVQEELAPLVAELPNRLPRSSTYGLAYTPSKKPNVKKVWRVDTLNEDGDHISDGKPLLGGTAAEL